MKLTIPRGDLDRALKAVTRAIATRSPVPSLGHIRLEAEGTRATVTANDLEIVLAATVKADVQTPGAVLLPGKVLAEIAAKLPAGDVEIVVDGLEATLRAGRSRFKLNTLPVDAWPALTIPGASDPIYLDAATLASAIQHVTYCAGDEDKAVICGILFQFDPSGLTLVATDGYRLSTYTLATACASTSSIIIPRRAVDELARQLAGIDGEIAMAWQENHIRFTIEGRVLQARALDGQYPPYQAILPKAHEKRVEVNRQEFLAAVERASIMASELEGTSIQVELGADGMLVISSGTQRGQSTETVAATFEGEPLTLQVNAGFLTQVLTKTVGERVTLKLNTPLTPIVLASDVGDHWTGLLMPLNKAK